MFDRPTSRFSRMDLLCGVAAGAMAALAATGAGAQSAPTPLSGVDVGGAAPTDYKIEQPALVKLTQPLLDTPQSIATVSRQVMDDRGDTTLGDALRNVAGISLGAGESSWQGTNLSIRGFNARNDIYLDGMRDFGSYYRDPFDLEEVEVLEGPDSMLFGRGSTGGVVNQVSKVPTLQGHERAELVAGTDTTKRFTGDVDIPLDLQGAAFRLNVMAHQSEVAGREDGGRYGRYGFAPSLALGLGTPTRVTFSYLHQSEADVPDYGIPWLLGKPAPVDRSNFYGFKGDYLRTDADVATIEAEHDYNDHITIRDQFRYANYNRDWRDTEPLPATGTTAATPLANIVINRNIQSGHSREYLLQNQTDVTARFNTGAFSHTLVAGVEFGPERSSPEYDNSTGVPSTSLLTPNENQAFAGTTYPRIITDTKAFTVGVYAVDTLKIGTHLELTGGIRWDSFYSDYESQNFSVPPAALGNVLSRVSDKHTDDQPSYRAAIVYKPVTTGSLYFDYSTSFNPSAEQLSQIVAVRSLNQGNLFLKPEENVNYEVGTKWELFAAKLFVQGAVFREEKTNARVPDPNNPGFNVLGGDQRVDGADIEIAGQLTPWWKLKTSYTYLDSRVIKSAVGGPAVGMALFNAPHNSFNLWTTFQLPQRIEIGGGPSLMSARLGQNTPPIETAPGYTTYDAMVKWQATPHLRLQVNLVNLTDAYYADQIHGFHIIPGPGRSALFTLAVAY